MKTNHIILVFILIKFIFFSTQTMGQFREGEIIKRKNNFAIIKISLGWELTPGQNLKIFRNISGEEKEIGEGKVVRLTRSEAVIKIIGEKKTLKIKRGDWVASLGDNYEALLEPFNLLQNSIKFKAGYGATPLHNLNNDISAATHKYQQMNMTINPSIFSVGALTLLLEYSRPLFKFYKAGISFDYIGNKTSMTGRHAKGPIQLDKSIHNFNLLVNSYLFYEDPLKPYKLFIGVGGGFSVAALYAHIKMNHQNSPQLDIDAQSKQIGYRFTEHAHIGLEMMFSKKWGIALEGIYRFRRIPFAGFESSGKNQEEPPAKNWLKNISANEMDLSGGTLAGGVVFYF